METILVSCRNLSNPLSGTRSGLNSVNKLGKCTINYRILCEDRASEGLVERGRAPGQLPLQLFTSKVSSTGYVYLDDNGETSNPVASSSRATTVQVQRVRGEVGEMRA